MSIGSIDIWLDDPLTVELNPGGGNPFATIQLTPSPGKVWIGVRTPADADELIKAAVAAKDILTTAHRAPGDAIRIDADRIRVVERPDLGEAIVYLNDGADAVHVEDAATGRALATAFAEAAQMREAAERAEQGAKDLHPAPVDTEPDCCPRCGSHDPKLHPATQADGGEVQPCPHPFHDPLPGHVRGCLRSWERAHATCPVEDHGPGPTAPDAADHTGHSASGSSDPGDIGPNPRGGE